MSSVWTKSKDDWTLRVNGKVVAHIVPKRTVSGRIAWRAYSENGTIGTYVVLDDAFYAVADRFPD